MRTTKYIMNKYKLNGIILIINPALFIAGTSKVISALSPIFYMVFFKFGKTPKNIPAQIIIGLYSTILIIKEMRI